MTRTPRSRGSTGGDAALPDSVLAVLSVDELQAVLSFIDESERAGRLSAEEALRWRQRVAEWHRFRKVCGTESHTDSN